MGCLGSGEMGAGNVKAKAAQQQHNTIAVPGATVNVNSLQG
jgi:hypothetical protein